MQIEVPARAIVVAIKRATACSSRCARCVSSLSGNCRQRSPHAVHIAVRWRLFARSAGGLPTITSSRQRSGVPPDQSLHQLVDYLHRRRFVGEWRRKVPARARSALRRQLGSFPSQCQAEMGRLAVKVMGQSPAGVNARKCSTAPLIAEMDKPNRAAGSGQPIQRVAPFPQQLRVGESAG